MEFDVHDDYECKVKQFCFEGIYICIICNLIEYYQNVYIYLYDISEINYIVIVRLHNLIMKNYNVQVNLEHCMLRN